MYVQVWEALSLVFLSELLSLTTYLRKLVLTVKNNIWGFPVQSLRDLEYLGQLWAPLKSEDSDTEWHRAWPDGSKVCSLVIAVIINKCIGEGKTAAIHRLLQCQINLFYKPIRLLSTGPQATFTQPCSKYCAPSKHLWGTGWRNHLYQLCVFRINLTDVLFSSLPGVVSFKWFFGIFI